MNDLLRKLAEQAREYANSSQPYEKIKNKAWIDVYDEKFAELIVQECAELVETQHTWITSVAASALIRKHFGVE